MPEEEEDESSSATKFDFRANVDDSWEAIHAAAAGNEELDYHPWSAHPAEYKRNKEALAASTAANGIATINTAKSGCTVDIADDPLSSPEEEEKVDPRDEITLPSYATFYKFHPQYTMRNIPKLMAEHSEYVKKFNRLSSCDEINLNGLIGLCGLWKGSEEEAEETMAQINEFMEGDPLIRNGIVELKDVIDLSKRSLWDAGRNTEIAEQ